MDTLWIQINLRSFINQMDASSWFMTPFWFKCRFFCNVVWLWRRYKYTVDISIFQLKLIANFLGNWASIRIDNWGKGHIKRWYLHPSLLEAQLFEVQTIYSELCAECVVSTWHGSPTVLLCLLLPTRGPIHSDPYSIVMNT